MAGQLYGSVTGGHATVPSSGVSDYFTSSGGLSNGVSSKPVLDSWEIKNSKNYAMVVSNYDPSAGYSTTWPKHVPSGATYSGGVTTATKADVQEIRYDSTHVYINAPGLASHGMGPWFDPTMSGGMFSNYPSNQSHVISLPLYPVEASTKSSSGMGPQGMFVNGISAYNFLDGASYSNSSAKDIGGGSVFATATILSAASGENGPHAPGSLVVAKSTFAATLASTTATTTATSWPTVLGGTSLTLKDSAGTTHDVQLKYVSPSLVEFLVPSTAATGFATLTFKVGTSTVPANMYILGSYPNLFVDPSGYGTTSISTSSNGSEIAANDGIADATSTQKYLVVKGSGLGNATSVTATLGGYAATVTHSGTVSGLLGVDAFVIKPPTQLVGKTTANLVITVAGRPSNSVIVKLAGLY